MPSLALCSRPSRNHCFGHSATRSTNVTLTPSTIRIAKHESFAHLPHPVRECSLPLPVLRVTQPLHPASRTQSPGVRLCSNPNTRTHQASHRRILSPRVRLVNHDASLRRLVRHQLRPHRRNRLLPPPCAPRCSRRPGNKGLECVAASGSCRLGIVPCSSNPWPPTDARDGGSAGAPGLEPGDGPADRAGVRVRSTVACRGV